MVSIYCLLSFFSDAADNEHSYLVEIPVDRSIFECNIQKSIPRSLQLKILCYFQEQEYVIEIWNCNDRYQRLVSDQQQVSRAEWKIFTRFVFKLVFRVSGKVCHEINLWLPNVPSILNFPKKVPPNYFSILKYWQQILMWCFAGFDTICTI